MAEETKKEQPADEDVLLKLTMPGQSLREETLQKGKEAQTKHLERAQQQGSSPTQPQQHLEPNPDEDILTKLAMPGQSLREETLQKKKEAEQKYGNTLAPQQLEPQPQEDFLTKISKPTLSSSAPEPQRETPRSDIGGTVQSVDANRVQQIAESIFSSDFSFGKKKK